MSWTGKAEKMQRVARRAIGEPIEYRREGYAVLTFNAVFIDMAVSPLIYDGMIGTGQAPVIDVSLSEMGGLYPERDDHITLLDRDECYYVAEIKSDGEGEVNLKLRRDKAVA